MWEIFDQETREKILASISDPTRVFWSRSADGGIASISGMTRSGVLDSIRDHLQCGYALYADLMRNGDLAYIFHCFLGDIRGYVKLKFHDFGFGERAYIFSAHKDR